jgi:hypothetical protein
MGRKTTDDDIARLRSGLARYDGGGMDEHSFLEEM